MHANLYATFRLIARTKTVPLDLPAGVTARQALDAILEQIPALRPHWLNEQGEIHAHVHGFINGREIPTLDQGWETPLQAEDVLDFFPPVAGG